MKNLFNKRNYLAGVIFLILFAFSSSTILAETQTTDISDRSFNLIVCDGPAMPNQPSDWRVCDFPAVMKQIQRLINVAIVLGVVVAIVAFSYAGYLYVTGEPNKISQAHEIFKKVIGGFVIMLSAWFIVYQLLSWLAKPGFTSLLANP